MISFLKEKTSNLFTGYFALTMATGALSISLFLLDVHFMAKILLYANSLFYIILWILTILRLIWHFPKVIADLTSHEKGPGFFTLIAGTCVFGSQLIIVGDVFHLAKYLWFFSIFLWLLIMYSFFFSVTIRKEKPRIAQGINGAWLIAAVATQSVSVLGTLLSPHFTNGKEIILFFTFSMFLLGCMLYLNIIALIFYRFTFVDFKHESLTPPYWINMGAVAIATLAGSNLILNAKHSTLLTEVIPFLKGFTLFYWITGTWWIPLLFILMIWKYIYEKIHITYDPQFWGMAFPLAMYTTCTIQLSKALEFPFLMVVPKIMIFIAITVWILVFLGLIRSFFIKNKINTYPR
ncbi:tellurite resistance/C4-dicarboxylate transporter family protein [Bacillus sp. MM2020_4]|uniref:tellurite resistance/C4-dicarboxylate transporter family protein n=2 Tax=Bacillaceae TaxID=186817 RepID=UPI0014090137|nr:tellurite resistance/C4-dicarboxylate transporter family protein [Bacillus sp. MM2020_4]NHC16692.1 C4-dicarboxylate ABC transporter [Bacillus sp. MM2020_4]